MYPKNIYISYNEPSNIRECAASFIPECWHSWFPRPCTALGVPSNDSDNYSVDIHLDNDCEDI